MTESQRKRIIKKEWNFLFGVLIVIAVVFGGALALSKKAIKKGSTHPLALTAMKITGSSVAKVNDKKISYTDYISDKTALQKFYSTDTSGLFQESTDEDIDRQVLSRLITSALISQVADEFDVSISEDDLAAARRELVSSFETEEAATQEIQTRYGWEIGTFVKNVISPVLLEQKLAEHFASSDDLPEGAAVTQVRARHILFQPEEGESADDTRARAQAVLDRIQGGEDFADLAVEYGTDGTKSVGGDLGWFTSGMMVKPFEDAVFALQKDELSDLLVETEFGYHIVQKTDERQTADFATYMDQKLSDAAIEIYLGLPNPFTTE